MNFESPQNLMPRGLSSQEKKKMRITKRKEKLQTKKERSRRHEDYGDLKVSRRIPKEITEKVQQRDTGRDFGRPNHKCEKPGAPHHIIYFEDFLSGKVEGLPHTVENLEAPCKECHKLAHELGIRSGTSIEDFFREKFAP